MIETDWLVDEIAGGGGRVATIVEPAGAGKTNSVLASVAATYQPAGRDVVVFGCCSAAAARSRPTRPGWRRHDRRVASRRRGHAVVAGRYLVDEALD